MLAWLTGDLGSPGRISWAPPWQSWQLAARLAGFGGAGMEAVGVGLLRVCVALGADDFLRRGVVDKALDVVVAIDAGEHAAMDGMPELGFVDKEADGFAVDVHGERASEWQARQSSSLSLCWALAVRADSDSRRTSE